MARPSAGKWIQSKELVLPGKEDCYVYKRPGSNTWQYFLAIPGEGEERKSTKVKGDPDDPTVGLEAAKDVALARKLVVMSRQQSGLKTPRSKRLFDFIDDYLAEEQRRVSPFNRKGFITAETFRRAIGFGLHSRLILSLSTHTHSLSFCLMRVLSTR